jgi:hypothetical protein
VRDDLYHGAVLRIPSQRFRSAQLEDSHQVDPEDLSGADRFGHPALHPAPEFARIALSDHAEQTASLLVHAGAAFLFLRIGGCGRPGHDDLRVHAERPKAFGRQLELPVLVTLGGALLVALWVNLLLRFEDYFHRGLLGQIFKPSYEAYFLWLELTLTFVIPIAMLSFKKVRLSPQWLYLASVCTVLGFITNRLNIALIGFETYVGHHYVPKWTEFSITLMIIAMGFALFGVAVKYLPIFPEEGHHAVKARLRTETGPVVSTPVLGHAGD